MTKFIAFWIVLVNSVVFVAQHALPPRQPLSWVDVAAHLGALALAGVIAFPERLMPLLALVASVIPSIRLGKKKEADGE